jgi:uncharacterized protein (TIGR02145 family)
MDGTINTLTICDETDSSNCITMMDRNLWATTNDISSTWSYGNHYQWWNNYGFSPWNSVTTSNAQVACNNPFSSSTFIIENEDYCSTPNNNLWWDTTNTVEARRWPCDEGYHVPSAAEWSNLMNIWAGTDVDWWMYTEAYWWDYDIADIAQFQSDFKIPFAGYRYDYDGSVNFQGDFARLWSSSSYADENVNANSRAFYVDGGAASLDDGILRAAGLSVRCFKDSALSSPAEWSGNENPSAQILLTINKGTLSIGIDTGVVLSGSLNLGSLQISNSVQVKTWAFGSNSFRVDDQKWVESGYYTTLSVTDLVWENPAHVIWAENIQLKSENSTVSLISGTPVNDSYVLFSNQIQNWVTATWSITYFNRQNTDTADAGRLGKYWDNLQIKVTVPAHTMADTYRGTITYTLYDLDQ